MRSVIDNVSAQVFPQFCKIKPIKLPNQNSCSNWPLRPKNRGDWEALCVWHYCFKVFNKCLGLIPFLIQNNSALVRTILFLISSSGLRNLGFSGFHSVAYFPFCLPTVSAWNLSPTLVRCVSVSFVLSWYSRSSSEFRNSSRSHVYHHRLSGPL